MKRTPGCILSGMAAAALLLSVQTPLHASEKKAVLQTVNSYADLADLALQAPIVVEAKIKKTRRLSERDSSGIPNGHVRYLVTAEVTRLIASRRALPATVSYLVDVPLDSRGKPPRIKGSRAFLFLKPGNNDQNVTLVSRHGQIDWTAAADQMIRAILTESSGSDRAFTITGIGNAFHVPGTVPGESETQIFLTTSDQRPVSLTVLRRPGESPQWSVSLDEMVDESSRPAGRDTLLWYRLACFLPHQMPDSALSSVSPEERAAIIADYALVLQQLGACGRQLSAA